MLSLLAEHLALHRLGSKLAIADTPGAAHAIARYGGQPINIIAPEQHADALAFLPVEALRIAGETAAGLRRLGLDLIGQLATTPRAPLARRFGNGLLTRLDQALGRVREPIQPVLPPDTISVRRTFVEPHRHGRGLRGGDPGAGRRGLHPAGTAW